MAEATEFIRVFGGEQSAFFNQISSLNHNTTPAKLRTNGLDILRHFIRYIENGLHNGISIERKAQFDVVSDFLDQANHLLSNEEVHPAAPTVLIGASLEEFLRNWVEDKAIDIEEKNPGIYAYASALRRKELISKQDMKDITSWGGLRNSHRQEP